MAGDKFTTEDFADIDVSRMAVAVTDAYFKHHPELGPGVQLRIREKCHQDVGYHYQFLSAAILCESREVFEQYAAWLKEVFESNNLPLSHLEESFELISRYIGERVQPALAEAVAEVMRSGTEQLAKPGMLVPVETPANALVLPGAKPYTDALLVGSQRHAGQVISQALGEGQKLVDVGVGIIQPAMYEVGRLWQASKLTVAQEHLATAISQTLLARSLMAEEYAEPNDRRALFACVAGNHHMLGLRMVSDAYEVAGWDVDFLGADTPAESIVQLVDESKPDMIGLSVSMPGQVMELSDLVQRIRGEFSGSRPVITVGGQVLNSFGELTSGLGADEWFTDAKQAVEKG
ncbi:MAG: cobalamin-dependent protein [Sedimenticola sp.]